MNWDPTWPRRQSISIPLFQLLQHPISRDEMSLLISHNRVTLLYLLWCNQCGSQGHVMNANRLVMACGVSMEVVFLYWVSFMIYCRGYIKWLLQPRYQLLHSSDVYYRGTSRLALQTIWSYNKIWLKLKQNVDIYEILKANGQCSDKLTPNFVSRTSQAQREVKLYALVELSFFGYFHSWAQVERDVCAILGRNAVNLFVIQWKRFSSFPVNSAQSRTVYIVEADSEVHAGDRRWKYI